MEEAAFSRVLDGIYDAATAFDRWPAALEQIGEAFSCSYVGLIDRNLRTMEGRAAAVGIDLPGQREYFQVWSNHDILRQRTRVFRPGAIETDREIVPRSELLRSDYYNGFLKPHDMHAYMRVTLSVENGFRKIISMARPASLGDFETSDVEQYRRLVPHLQRAARVTQHVDDAKLMATGFSEVLERSATGVVILDRSGSVLFANRAARSMAQAADGFTLRLGRLGAIGAHDAALQRLIAGALARTDRADAARGGVLRLPRTSGKRDYAVAVARFAHSTTWTESGRPVAFMLITDPDAAPADSNAAVRQFFGLSAAEARIAERLMMGDSPEQAAAVLNIKTSTARWHLASLYRKTGTSRQAQLVRMLLKVPVI